MKLLNSLLKLTTEDTATEPETAQPSDTDTGIEAAPTAVLEHETAPFTAQSTQDMATEPETAQPTDTENETALTAATEHETAPFTAKTNQDTATEPEIAQTSDTDTEIETAPTIAIKQLKPTPLSHKHPTVLEVEGFRIKMKKQFRTLWWMVKLLGITWERIQ